MTKPLFDVFRDAMERKPSASRKEALDQFVAAMKSDPKYLEDLATDYFHRMSAAWTVRDEKHGYSFGRVVEPSVKIEDARTKRAASAERTATALETLKAKIRDVILLDQILPNGVAVRHATGAEMAKAGGYYAEVAKHIKPTEVVDRHLSEANLQDISARYFQRNETKVA